MKSTAHVKHFANRAGFGLSLPQYTRQNKFLVSQTFSHAKEVTPLYVIPGPGEEEEEGMADSTNRKKKAAKKNDLVTLNINWNRRFTDTPAILREKMTLFWHNHFACRIQHPFLAQQQNNTFRRLALGKFGDLLMAVSKDPAMLQFLNNRQNKKDSPNENFARELLELFTLGLGHYTEADIKNTARAFTGWSFNSATSKYEFRYKVHDFGPKTFRGKTGKFTGEDILHMLLEDRQTANFITRKIWRSFVSEDVMDKEILNTLAQHYYHSAYNTKKLLNEIFTSTWFYEERFIASRIKSPVELVTGILNHTGGRFTNDESVLFIQRVLGQVLFLPPNVGGWPSGKGWIDSSSLTFRMRLPEMMLKNATPDVELKDDGDMNNQTNEAKAHKLEFMINWEPLTQAFTKSSAEESLTAIEHYLLLKPTHATNRQLIRRQAEKATADPDFIKNAFIGYMALPEYQLC